MAPTDDNSVPGINVAGKNGAAFPVMGNAATGAILVASAGRGTGAISNAPKDANHVSGLIAKDKATGKAFAVQGNKDTGAIFVQDLNGGGGGGAATWGSITGDISDNAELTRALDKKADKVINAFSGTGQPNGKVSAPPGSEYTDTAVTCGAVKWIKMWGTGNTGWTVLYGDTGWRDIKALLDPFWDSTSNIQLRRINKVVYLRSSGLKVGDNPGTGAHAVPKRILKENMFPNGFRNSGWGTGHGLVNVNGAQLGSIYSQSNSFDLSIRAIPGYDTWTKGESCSFNISYVTENDWPTILPGGG